MIVHLTMGRKKLLLVFFVIVACVSLGFIILKPKEVTYITPSHIAPEELRELERRAAAGDPVAQYGLTLYIDDEKRVHALMESAAKAGYPPAVVTYADKIMSTSKQNGIKARKMLENVAKAGYYPAIFSLAHCIAEGECGPESKKDAITWAISSRLLAEQKRIDNNDLDDVEKNLRPELRSEDINRAEAEAKLLVTKMQNVTHRPKAQLTHGEKP